MSGYEEPDRPRPTSSGRTLAITILLSTLASLLVSLVTAALSSSLPAVWVGALVGAALPPLITTVGPWQSLRVGAAVAATAIAVVLACSAHRGLRRPPAGRRPSIPIRPHLSSPRRRR